MTPAPRAGPRKVADVPHAAGVDDSCRSLRDQKPPRRLAIDDDEVEAQSRIRPASGLR